MSRITKVNLTLVLAMATLAVSPLSANQGKSSPEMRLTSSSFVNNKAMPATFSCDGKNISPALAIEGVPREAKSLALIVDDPDAPAGVWVHWLLWNIDPGSKEIAQGTIPPGAVQGVNSFGKKGYGGPCPPSGTHHYIFRLYALKDRLQLPGNATRHDLDRAMQGKILARGELIGLYSRK